MTNTIISETTSSKANSSKEKTLTTIAVIGAGYVGLSNAILLAQAHLQTKVILFDIDSRKIAQLQQRISPLQDREICEYLADKPLNLTATDEANDIYESCELVIVATPTNYDVASGKFDTSSVEASIRSVRGQHATVPIVIKSTIPIGFTDSMREIFDDNILFMPEFLREGQALYDNLYPSRIIVGATNGQAEFANSLMALYQKASQSHREGISVTTLLMPPTEAEAVKLFANSYLATRIAFFNELDSFAEKHNLDSQSIITGVSLDPRIGEHYNNPSFGYGGYCLPKDTQQLKANYIGIPANLIYAIVDANNTRKRFIARQIIDKNPNSIGIYRLSMKKDADNFRDSAVLDIIQILKQHGMTIRVYEPALATEHFEDCEITPDLATFKQQNDLIVANRWHDELLDVKDKVYSRDVFGYS
ncbi:nucleotide sugar dehydrogenase [Psychrobacter pygoscelis]|uniref:nucleotide sugar dehydrogenase n=1 Tax=Psychrobacter pygoscelis TaxID=2488563 RepID=UPI00103ED506|nr:nucleotide sugar dehydrogenase [Psychrobacter pygoscelis]